MRNVSIGCAGLLAGVLAVAVPASAATITFTPTAIGLSGAAFTASALKASEVSHITFVGPNGEYVENGYAQVTGAVIGGNVVTPGGMNSSYTLYAEFHLTGLGPPTGTIDTVSMTFFAVAGTSTFGFDGNNDATVTHVPGNVPITVMSLTSLVSGSVGAAGPNLFATLTAGYTLPGNGALVVYPNGTPLFRGDFFHTALDGGVMPLLDAGFNLTGFKITGGDDTLYFVPEPASMLLLGAGLLGLGLTRRRGVD